MVIRINHEQMARGQRQSGRYVRDETTHNTSRNSFSFSFSLVLFQLMKMSSMTTSPEDEQSVEF